MDFTPLISLLIFHPSISLQAKTFIIEGRIFLEGWKGSILQKFQSLIGKFQSSNQEIKYMVLSSIDWMNKKLQIGIKDMLDAVDIVDHRSRVYKGASSSKQQFKQRKGFWYSKIQAETQLWNLSKNEAISLIDLIIWAIILLGRVGCGGGFGFRVGLIANRVKLFRSSMIILACLLIYKLYRQIVMKLLQAGRARNRRQNQQDQLPFYNFLWHKAGQIYHDQDISKSLNSHHFLLPRIISRQQKILMMYMYRNREAKMGWSIGNSPISPPIIIFVMTTRQIPKITIAKAQQMLIRAGILVKIAVIPITNAAEAHTRIIPSQIRQFPRQRNAQIVSTSAMATVPSTATGTIASFSGLLSTTAEQQRLIIQENESTNTSRRTKSMGKALALGTQQASIITPMRSRMGKTTIQAQSSWN